MTSNRYFLRTFCGAAAGLSLAVKPAVAQESSSAEGEPPVLVELFLSQACSMCPPAAALFPQIAARDDVVALSWHIDYWNMTSSANGRWEDPFSKSEFTTRQKRYNKNIRHKSSIYTPQIVVGGEMETVGGKKEKISALIETAPRTGAPIEASLSRGGMQFEIGESDAGGNAYIVTFKKSTSTRITGGANAGKIFAEANVVTGIRPLGLVRKRGGELWVEKPSEGESCALIVQEPGQKRISAAVYCPL